MTAPDLLKSNSNTDHPPRRSLIGTYPNHWLYSPSPPTFDLTCPSPPEYALPSPNDAISLSATTTSIIISPSKTALVIVDMQNFFLSTYLGRSADSAGNNAKRRLLDTAIPAARKAGVQIIWLNWGLTDEEIEHMPPSTQRAFGFEVIFEGEAKNRFLPAIDAHGVNQAAAEHFLRDKDGMLEEVELTENGKPKRIYRGLGSEIGPLRIEDGKIVDAGRLLMRDTWNAGLPTALNEAYKEGQNMKEKPDVWIHKNRMSGLWGSSTPCTEFLEKEGVKTLLFAGVNTDQCVAGSLQDAFTKGWDCILLKDAVRHISNYLFLSEAAFQVMRVVSTNGNADCLSVAPLAQTSQGSAWNSIVRGPGALSQIVIVYRKVLKRCWKVDRKAMVIGAMKDWTFTTVDKDVLLNLYQEIDIFKLKVNNDIFLLLGRIEIAAFCFFRSDPMSLVAPVGQIFLLTLTYKNKHSDPSIQHHQSFLQTISNYD